MFDGVQYVKRMQHMNHRANSLLLSCASAFVTATVSAQSVFPAVIPWKINTTGQTGYQGIAADVQGVRFGQSYVYVASTGIPSYAIGPWPGNPGAPTNQNWSFRIPRNPVLATTLPTVGLGHIGVFVNGVTMFNPSDARSYNNLNIWHQNAMWFEASGFDTALGHPAMVEYHHHQRTPGIPSGNPTHHSPIIGYAFDGFPIYGPYGYANADGSGGIARLTTSWRKRNITQRTTLPNGTQLPANQYGPPVSATYPLGAYIEDFEYVPGLGVLGESNGRQCVTPDYPNGTYAYFGTVDSAGMSEYPYLIGQKYRGTLVTGNTGPNSGHNTPTETVVTFCCTPCEADTDLSRVVDGADMAVLLSHWGPVGGAGDLNRDGRVDAADLTAMLAAWGSCP